MHQSRIIKLFPDREGLSSAPVLSKEMTDISKKKRTIAATISIDSGSPEDQGNEQCSYDSSSSSFPYSDDEENFNFSDEEQPLKPKTQKRRKSSNDSYISNSSNDFYSTNDNRFRPHHFEMWQKRFAELVEFQKNFQHCLVPHDYQDENLAVGELCRWVRRQRYQYNLYQQKKHSSMTLERIQNLDSIGFVWDSREALWQERLRELLKFEEEYGNCDVPAIYAPNPQLGSWVKCQRRQYKLYLEGKSSNMTKERKEELEKHDFQWRIRKSIPTSSSSKKNESTFKNNVERDSCLPKELRERIHSLSLEDIEKLTLLNALSKNSYQAMQSFLVK